MKQGSTQTWSSVLPIHPAANLLPRMSDSELADLMDDIKRNGQQVEIAIFIDENGVEKLLDGRNRLDAMERIGIPVVKDGEQNRDAVRTFNVPGNVDPYKYVLSANVHRRHLSPEQKREAIEKYLKANPNQSNRTIAKQLNADDKTVGKYRKKLESTAEIPQLKKTTGADGKEGKRPVRTSKSWPAVTDPEIKDLAVKAQVSADQLIKAAVVLDERQQEINNRRRASTADREALDAYLKTVKKKPTEQPSEASLAAQIRKPLAEVYALISQEQNWPPLDDYHRDRRDNAIGKFGSVRTELLDLATPRRAP